MGIFDKAKGNATETIGKAETQYGKATDSPEHLVKGKAKEICGAAKQATSQLLDSAQECTQEAQVRIKEKPLTAVAIFAGVGFVVGYLLGKK